MATRRAQGTSREKSSAERWRERWEWLSGQDSGGQDRGPSRLLLGAVGAVGAVLLVALWLSGQSFTGGSDVGLVDAIVMAAIIVPVAVVLRWFRRH